MENRARKTQNGTDENKTGERSRNWKDTFTELGALAITAFVSGAAMACGAHGYHAITSSFGGKAITSGRVIPIRKCD